MQLMILDQLHGRLAVLHESDGFGKYDANYGLLLKGDGKGQFVSIPQRQSGFNLKGDIRSAVSMKGYILFGINQQGIRAFKTKL